MNFLVWRLHRSQVYFAVAALLAVTVLLLVTGNVMANDYHQFLSTCAATHNCGNTDQVFSGDGAILDFVGLTVVVPLLLGVFWGAPLLAKEFEDGTHSWAWSQGIMRKAWLRTNLFWLFTAAIVWGGVLSLLVSWWRFPENAIDGRFAAFDVQGVAPIAYSVFAVALGMAVGTFVKRVLPALATTIGVFAVTRVLIEFQLRRHYLTPVSKLTPLKDASSLPVGAWIYSTVMVGSRGRTMKSAPGVTQVPPTCQPGSGANFGNCLANHGFHQLAVYQPDSRFWAFQGIEACIYLALAVGLVMCARWWVLSRDA